MSKIATLSAPGALLIAGIAFAGTALAQVTNHCQVTPLRSNALDFPSKHAWDLFLVFNHPAIEKSIERGKADCSKKIGHVGSTSVWETWRNGKTEVFLEDGSEPPHWNDNSLPDAKPGTTPQQHVMTTSSASSSSKAKSSEFSFHNLTARSAQAGPMFSPGTDGVFNNRGGFGETRMNRSTYDFIKRECLWSRDGQNRYARAIVDGKKPLISLPSDSVEVKAAWLDLEKEGIEKERWSKYYSAEYQGKKYGLAALHILTKDTPNWFWASFHHVDAPDNKQNHVPDAHGMPPQLIGTVWENYRLSGTQIEFETATGKPTILSDHYVEFGFQRSSCITCHSTATISPDGRRKASQEHALCILSPNIIGVEACKEIIGASFFKQGSQAGTEELISERGSPMPEWFMENGKPYYFQTDFLYSIQFRGRNERNPPPARCVW